MNMEDNGYKYLFGYYSDEEKYGIFNHEDLFF